MTKRTKAKAQDALPPMPLTDPQVDQIRMATIVSFHTSTSLNEALAMRDDVLREAFRTVLALTATENVDAETNTAAEG